MLLCHDSVQASGITRFKYDGGWVSDKAGDGRAILELIEDDDEPVE